MASEVIKMAVRGNMQNHPRVIEVAHFKYVVKIGIGIGIYHTTIKKPQHAGLWGHFPLVPHSSPSESAS